MSPISRKPYTDIVCGICIVLMLALVLLYQNGAKLGIRPLEKEEALSELSASAVISLNDQKIRIKGKGAYHEGGVITVAYGGEYTFTGSCSDARIVVQADKKAKVKLIFDNAELTAHGAPVIYVANGGKTTLISAKNSKNTLCSLGEFTEEFTAEDIDAAIFSKDDLILDGKGFLSLTAESGHGIVSKDDLDLRGGEWLVNAQQDGLRGRDSIELDGGSYTVICGGDGMKSNNDVDEDRGSITVTGGALTLTAGQDGIQAFRELRISGGELSVTTGGGHGEVTVKPKHTVWIRPGEEERPDPDMINGGQEKLSQKDPRDEPAPFAEGDTTHTPRDRPGEEEPFDLDTVNNGQEKLSQKGLKAGTAIFVEGGTITLNCADDGIHSDGTAVFTGGTLTVESGDDAVHANRSISFADTALLVPICMEGIEARQIEILSGSIDVTAVNDGINANGESRGVNMSVLSISGGSVKLHADGDGMDSNGHIFISGGSILVSADPSDGNSAVDYGIENGGDCTISGGTIVACGFAGMAETFSNASTQCSVLYAFEEAYPGGTVVELRDEKGAVLLRFEPENTFDCVIFSCPELKIGREYTVAVDGKAFSLIPDSISSRYGANLERPEFLPHRDPSHMGGFGG